jgi:hypothetical protein
LAGFIPARLGNDLCLEVDRLYARRALLRKEREAQTSPFPGRTYPMDSVTGMPSAV